MDYPIVQVKTRDEIWLHGLYLHKPQDDAVLINIHGTASNFYEEYFIEVLAKKIKDKNISLLSTNNRGAGVYDAYQEIGAAVEKFEDCLTDIDAWIEFALKDGFKEIILSGHSLGTEKVVYYATNGKYADKVNAIILFAPADSYGSHRVHEGRPNPRAQEIETLLEKSQKLIAEGKGNEFLPRHAYGSHEGIMPKSAESFVNFLGPDSKVLNALPLATEKLETFSKIKVPILAVIGDQNEYTALTTTNALELMRRENPLTETIQIRDCDHDFQGKEEELAEIVLKFLKR